MMNTKTPPSARQRSLSPRQLAANRANALKSTGPRTTAGKTRSRQNSLKHGLRVSADYAMIPEECPDTFAIFRQELRDALQPSNVLQLSIFPQIVNLAWRLQRCPEAQAKIFELERRHIPKSARLTAPEILAQRCSDDPNNGFLLLNRYERSIENAFHRLLRLFKKCAGPDSYRPDELEPPPTPSNPPPPAPPAPPQPPAQNAPNEPISTSPKPLWRSANAVSTPSKPLTPITERTHLHSLSNPIFTPSPSFNFPLLL